MKTEYIDTLIKTDYSIMKKTNLKQALTDTDKLPITRQDKQWMNILYWTILQITAISLSQVERRRRRWTLKKEKTV